MVSKSGGARIKTNKVRSGPNQAFTLPKGTSAAPIMNVPKIFGTTAQSPKGSAAKSKVSATQYTKRMKQISDARKKAKNQPTSESKAKAQVKKIATIGAGITAVGVAVQELKKALNNVKKTKHHYLAPPNKKQFTSKK